MTDTLEKYFTKKILPAVTIEDPQDALKVAEVFLEGGLKVMEITFRTKTAAESIKKIRENLPDMIVGAGTLLTPQQAEKAKKAGAHFGVAPGMNSNVITGAQKINFPFIPGVITPSEVEQALELDCTTLKLFPAKQSGGVNRLKAIAAPYKHTGVSFIPMGGINPDNISQYLAYPEVLAVGGSWLAPKSLIQKQDFAKISEKVREALNISRSL